MSHSPLFEKGLKIRKEVLGEDYVTKSIAGADEITRTMAEWSTEFCWGALWSRPGLDKRTRSIVNLAMLGALGIEKALIITEAANPLLERAARNLPMVKVLRAEGANVYDILRHPHLVVTRAAVDALRGRIVP
jgi:alkylhydroperoxidase/carboxymuconolactone decarboxylase family protein YurZ